MDPGHGLQKLTERLYTWRLSQLGPLRESTDEAAIDSEVWNLALAHGRVQVPGRLTARTELFLASLDLLEAHTHGGRHLTTSVAVCASHMTYMGELDNQPHERLSRLHMT